MASQGGARGGNGQGGSTKDAQDYVDAITRDMKSQGAKTK